MCFFGFGFLSFLLSSCGLTLICYSFLQLIQSQQGPSLTEVAVGGVLGVVYLYRVLVLAMAMGLVVVDNVSSLRSVTGCFGFNLFFAIFFDVCLGVGALYLWLAGGDDFRKLLETLLFVVLGYSVLSCLCTATTMLALLKYINDRPILSYQPLPLLSRY